MQVAVLTHFVQAQRDPDEEGDYMAFEQLMADAQRKKEKDKTADKHHDDPAAHGKASAAPPKPHTTSGGAGA